MNCISLTESGGLVTCLDAHTGEKHQERIGGNYSASPTHSNERIYFHSREGVTTVLQAGKEFKVLAKTSSKASTWLAPQLTATPYCFVLIRHCIE